MEGGIVLAKGTSYLTKNQNGMSLKEKKRTSSFLRILGDLSKHWELYLMLLLPVVYIIVFQYLPMIGIVIGFEDYSIRRGIFGSRWVGLKYFKQFVTTPLFWQLLKNTLGISIYTLVVGFPIPIILALFLNEINNKFFKKTVQMVTYAPHFISTVVVVGILMQFLHVRNGFVNNVIVALGGKPINFIGNPAFFRSIYVWSGVWQGAGYSAIIYIAALAGVDQNIVEASIIDGVTRVQRVFYIDLPSIAPTIITLLILALGNIFSVGFEKIFLMQNPINLSYSEIISTFVYKKGLQSVEYSYATAVGVFNSIVNLILIISANTLARKTSETSLW